MLETFKILNFQKIQANIGQDIASIQCKADVYEKYWGVMTRVINKHEEKEAHQRRVGAAAGITK